MHNALNTESQLRQIYSQSYLRPQIHVQTVQSHLLTLIPPGSAPQNTASFSRNPNQQAVLMPSTTINSSQSPDNLNNNMPIMAFKPISNQKVLKKAQSYSTMPSTSQSIHNPTQSIINYANSGTTPQQYAQPQINIHANNGPPMHGELRKRQREEQFQQMKVEYQQMKNLMAKDKIPKQKKFASVSTTQQNKQGMFNQYQHGLRNQNQNLQNPTQKIDNSQQQQFFQDISHYKFPSYPDARNIQSAGQLKRDQIPQPTKFRQTNNFVQEPLKPTNNHQDYQFFFNSKLQIKQNVIISANQQQDELNSQNTQKESKAETQIPKRNQDDQINLSNSIQLQNLKILQKVETLLQKQDEAIDAAKSFKININQQQEKEKFKSVPAIELEYVDNKQNLTQRVNPIFENSDKSQKIFEDIQAQMNFRNSQVKRQKHEILRRQQTNIEKRIRSNSSSSYSQKRSSQLIVQQPVMNDENLANEFRHLTKIFKNQKVKNLKRIMPKLINQEEINPKNSRNHLKNSSFLIEDSNRHRASFLEKNQKIGSSFIVTDGVQSLILANLQSSHPNRRMSVMSNIDNHFYERMNFHQELSEKQKPLLDKKNYLLQINEKIRRQNPRQTQNQINFNFEDLLSPKAQNQQQQQSKKVTLGKVKTTFKYSNTEQSAALALRNFSPNNYKSQKVQKEERMVEIDDFVFGDQKPVDQNSQETITAFAPSSQTQNNQGQIDATSEKSLLSVRFVNSPSIINDQSVLLNLNKFLSQKQKDPQQNARSRHQFRFGQSTSMIFPTKNMSTSSKPKIKDLKQNQIVSVEELTQIEEQFLEYQARDLEIKKQIVKSFTVQLNAQKIKKQGVMIEEAQLADSILYLYWKQKMGKQYYVFCKPEVLDSKLQEYHFEEDKIEDQLIQYRVDIKFSVRDEDTPDKKQSDFYFNEILNQLDSPQMFSQKLFLDQELININFRDIMFYYYQQKNLNELSHCFYEIKKNCSYRILAICNQIYFNNRYQKIVEQQTKPFYNYQYQKLIEKEIRISKYFGKIKRDKWEVHSRIKDYIYRRSKICTTDLVKILFQPHTNNLFLLLFDSDEDYELQLTMDTIMIKNKFLINRRIKRMEELENYRQKILSHQSRKLLRKKLHVFQDKQHLHINNEGTSKPNSTSKITDSLQTDSNIDLREKILNPPRENDIDNDFIPLMRKNALRKNFGIRSGQNTSKQKTSFSLYNQILNSRMFKRQSTITHTKRFLKRALTVEKINDMYYEVSSSSVKNSRSEDSNDEMEEFKNYQNQLKNKIYNQQFTSQDNIQLRTSQQLMPFNNQKQIRKAESSKQENSELEESYLTSIQSQNEEKPQQQVHVPSDAPFNYQQEKLINKFGYECVIQMDEEKKYMFELFMPSEIKPKNNQRAEVNTNHAENITDSFETNMSLKNQVDDKFTDFDAEIQRKQLKKFFKKQKKKKTGITAHQSLLMRQLTQGSGDVLSTQKDITETDQKNDPHSQSSRSSSQFLRVNSKNAQSLKQISNVFQTIGTYYKNLTKQKKEQLKAQELEQDNEAAEIISAEDFEEDEQDNFYLRMQNNLHIMELLKEIGLGKDNYRGHKGLSSTRNSRRRKTLLSAKNSNINNKDNSEQRYHEHRMSEMGSLFNNSYDRIDSQSLELNSDKKKLKGRSGSNNQGDSSDRLEQYNNIRKLSFSKQIKSKKRKLLFEELQLIAKSSKFYQNSDFLKVSNSLQPLQRNLYMKDQSKIERIIVHAVTTQNFEQLKEYLPKYELSIDNFTDAKNNTLLNAASQFGGTEIVKLLLHYGSDPNIQNVSLYQIQVIQNEGNVPLHYSIKYDFKKITDLLLSYGADENIANNNGKTPWEGMD